MKKIVTIMFFVYVFININLIYGEKEIKLKKFYYDIGVSTKHIPFRVKFKGEFVKGLKKSDLKLLVNGKETEINMLYSTKKKIEETGKINIQKGRMFVIIINISNYMIDIKKNLNYFFDNILKTGDRFIFVSNNYFLNDRIILNPETIKTKIFKILGIELKKIKTKTIRAQQFIYHLLNDSYGMYKAGRRYTARTFFTNGYISYFREHKNAYMDLDTNQYIKLSEYLKNLEIDKWVLNFYQTGGFYQIDPKSKLDEFMNPMGPIFSRFYAEVNRIEKLPERSLSKYFIDSGATVHSIMMKYKYPGFIATPDGEWKLKYRTIATNSENVLIKMSELTGGITFSSRKTDKFFKQIIKKEDILYTIVFSTYNGAKNKKIEIIPNNKKYKILFNNQKKSQYMKNIAVFNEKYVPKTIINKIDMKNDTLSISFSDYYSDLKNPIPDKKMELRLTIINRKNEKTSKKHKVFFTTKINSILNIRIPNLKKGKHYFIVEIINIKSNQNDIKVYDFNKKT